MSEFSDKPGGNTLPIYAVNDNIARHNILPARVSSIDRKILGLGPDVVSVRGIKAYGAATSSQAGFVVLISR